MMNHRIPLLTHRLVIILFGILVIPLAASQKSTNQQFEARRFQLLNYYASVTQAPSFQAACAKLATGVDHERGIDFIRQKLNKPTGDMFYIYPLIGTYLYFHDKLPHDLHDRVRDTFRLYTPYRGDTENHWLMYYTAILLAAQTWPDMGESHWFNGKTSEENYEEALDYLNSWIHLTTTQGQGEFDSPDYAGVYLSPIALLYDHAEDPELKLKANMLMDYFLADWAGEHLKGMLCGGYSRVYEPQVYTPRKSIISTLLWLYFGDCMFNPRASIHEAIFPALSSYRCPQIIIQIARDRSTPYIHKEKKRVRNILRYHEERNPPVYKTNFMTDSYCLGSLQGGILQPIQQHTWDLTWISSKPNPRVFTIHPYFSERELAMFFPEEPKVMVAEVVKSKGTYDKEDKWTGGSPFEQTFQHKSAIIVLYNIKKGEGWPHIDGFFPKQLDERIVDESGWIFCREGDIYIAYFPLKPYQWIEEEVCYRLRSPFLKNGCILEVSTSKEFSHFHSFQRAIRVNYLDRSKFEKDLMITYTTLQGDVMTFTYNSDRLLNGESVDFQSYGLFQSPYLVSPLNSGKLEILYKNQKRILDFNTLTITQSVESLSKETDSLLR
jgi:hypothetical protein